MPSHALNVASGRKSPRPVGDDAGVILDNEATKYIAEEAEHERRFGPGSPTPVSVKDDGAKGTSFIGKLLSPLLAHPIDGQSSSDAPLDTTIASSSDRQTFGDVNLGADGLRRVQHLMLAALNR